MAELALGIAGLASLIMTAETTFKRISRYIKHAKGANDEIIRLSALINSLYATLQGVSLVISEFKADEKAVRDYQSHIAACHPILDSLSGKLAPFQNSKDLSSAKSQALQKLKWPFTNEETAATLQALQSHQAALGLALTTEGLAATFRTHNDFRALKDDVKHVRDFLEAQSVIEATRETETLLSTVAPVNPLHHHKTNLKLRHSGTGVWFLESGEFARWSTTANSTLWVQGIPGAGKSVLASAAISTALSKACESTVVAYFFCDYKSDATQLPRNVLGSIVAQIARQNGRPFKRLRDFVSQHSQGGRPQTFDCECTGFVDLITEMAEDVDELMVLVDGLDECGEHTRSLVSYLSELPRRSNKVKMMVFSRDVLDVRELLDDWNSTHIAAKSTDLQLYVADEVAMRTGPRARKRIHIDDEALKGEIVEGLVSGANGMFRWVTMQLDYFADLPTDGSIREALRTLPPGLDTSYERLLRTFIKKPAKTQSIIRGALRWVATYGTVEEGVVGEALSSELGNDYGAITDERILGLCGSLLRKVADNDSLELAHFTVKEYLTSQQLGSHESADLRSYHLDRIADGQYFTVTALRHILRSEFTRICDTGVESTSRINAHRFRAFIMPELEDLIRSHFADPQVGGLVKQLFSPIETNSLQSYMYDYVLHEANCDGLQHSLSPYQARKKVMFMSPLHVACYMGLDKVVKWLLEGEHNINNLSSCGSVLHCVLLSRFPISWCLVNPLQYLEDIGLLPAVPTEVMESMLSIVRMLLDSDVNVNLACETCHSALPSVLRLAAEYIPHDDRLFRELVRAGAICEQETMSFLNYLVENGIHLDQVVFDSFGPQNLHSVTEDDLRSLMLSARQLTNERHYGAACSGDEDRQAQIGAAIGQNDIAQCSNLLQHGASTIRPAGPCGYCDPLIQALCLGHLEIADLLLQHGAKLDGTTCDICGPGPANVLQLCVFWDADTILEGLLARAPEMLFLDDIPYLHPVHIAILCHSNRCLELMLAQSDHLWAQAQSCIRKDSRRGSEHLDESQQSYIPRSTDTNVPDTPDAWRLLTTPNLLEVVLEWEDLGGWNLMGWALNPMDIALAYSGVLESPLPLQIAVFARNFAAAETLLRHAADADQLAPSACGTALDVAATLGLKDFVDLLVQAGASLHACNRRGVSVAQRMASYAPDSCCVPVVRQAFEGPVTDLFATSQITRLASGPNFHAVSSLLPNSDHLVAPGTELCWDIKTFEYLLQSGANFAWIHPYLGSVLHTTWIPDKVLARICKRLGPTVCPKFLNFRPRYRFTPLYYAASSNQYKTSQTLLRFGADPNVPGGPEGTPLMAAAVYGRPALVKLLIYAGAEVCYRDADGAIISVYEKAKFFQKIQRWLLVERWNERKRIGWYDQQQ